MAEDSEYVLEPIREGADFTLYRGRERGNRPTDSSGREGAEGLPPSSLIRSNRHKCPDSTRVTGYPSETG